MQGWSPSSRLPTEPRYNSDCCRSRCWPPRPPASRPLAGRWRPRPGGRCHSRSRARTLPRHTRGISTLNIVTVNFNNICLPSHQYHQDHGYLPFLDWMNKLYLCSCWWFIRAEANPYRPLEKFLWCRSSSWPRQDRSWRRGRPRSGREHRTPSRSDCISCNRPPDRSCRTQHCRGWPRTRFSPSQLTHPSLLTLGNPQEMHINCSSAWDPDSPRLILKYSTERKDPLPFITRNNIRGASDQASRSHKIFFIVLR